MKIESIHFIQMVKQVLTEPNDELLKSMENMQLVVNAVRKIRASVRIEFKKPLKSVLIVNRSQKTIQSLMSIEKYLLESVNALEIKYETNERRYVGYQFAINWPELGKQYGKDSKKIAGELMQMKVDQSMFGKDIKLKDQQCISKDCVKVRKHLIEENKNLWKMI